MDVHFILCSYMLLVFKIQKIDFLIYLNQRKQFHIYNTILLRITKGNKQTKQPTNQPGDLNLYTF
jgi:hypothetical protein